MKRYFPGLFFLMCVLSMQSQNQDLIITIKGVRIYCSIQKDDSLSLSYTIKHQGSLLVIEKAEVKEYYYNLIKQKPKKQSPLPADPQAKKFRRDFVLIGGSLGIASPIGELADKNAYSETSGLANVGFFFQGSVAFKFTENFGLCGAYHHQQNKADADAINQVVMYKYAGLPFTTETTHWIISGLYGGVYIEKQISSVKGLSVFFNAMVGKPKYTSPSYVSTLAVPGYYFSEQQNSVSTYALGYILGPGVLYKVSDDVGFSFSMNYLGGKAKFTNVSYSNSNNFTAFGDFSQKFSSINTQIGLVICLGN